MRVSGREGAGAVLYCRLKVSEICEDFRQRYGLTNVRLSAVCDSDIVMNVGLSSYT